MMKIVGYANLKVSYMICILSFLLIHVTAEHNNINEIASKNDYPQNVTDTPVTIQERIKLHIIFKCIREC